MKEINQDSAVEKKIGAETKSIWPWVNTNE